MRAPVALLLFLLLAAPARAHEEDYALGQVFLGALPEGAVETFDLTPPNGTVPQGLLLLANVIVYEGNATLGVSFASGNTTFAEATAAPGAVTRVLAVATPRPGGVHLTLRNQGPGMARAGFYFDAACDCPAKALPVAVPHGLLAFPLDAAPRSHWSATVQEPPGHRLEVSLATFTASGASLWPSGFAVLDRSAAANATGAHEVRLEAREGGRHYVVVRSAAARNEGLDLSSDAALRASTLVRVALERLPDPAPTPAAPAALLLLALALGAGLRKR